MFIIHQTAHFFNKILTYFHIAYSRCEGYNFYAKYSIHKKSYLQLVFRFALHLPEQKCDNERKYCIIRYYFSVRGLHNLILFNLRMDSYAT